MDKWGKYSDKRMHNLHYQQNIFMRDNQMLFHRKTLLVDNNYKNYIENVRDDLNEEKKEKDKN